MNHTLTEAEIWSATDDQRRRLVALLETLTPDEWLKPSLCREWSVRDVVGHLIWQRDTHSAASLPRILMALARARGDMNRLISGQARLWAQRRSDAELLHDARGLIGHHRPIIGTPPINNLLDTIVHHQDITLPLHRGLAADPIAARAAAQEMWRQPKGFTLPVTVRLSAFRWQATDIDWDRGDGPLVEGPITAILCALMGRPPAFDHLTGAGKHAARSAVEAPSGTPGPDTQR